MLGGTQHFSGKLGVKWAIAEVVVVVVAAVVVIVDVVIVAVIIAVVFIDVDLL